MHDTATAAEDKPQSHSLTHRTLAGFFWLSCGSIVQSVLQLGVLMALSRLLSPREIGIASAALLVITVASIFSQVGIGPSIVQRLHLEERHLTTGMVTSVTLGCVLAVGIYGLSSTIAAAFRMPGLTPYLKMLAVIFPIAGLSVVAESVLQRELRFRQLSTISVISYGIGYGVVGITLAALHFGPWALVWAELSKTVVNTVICMALPIVPRRVSFEVRAFKELSYFGGGFTIARAMNSAALQGDNFVVGRWMGAEALGIYGRAYQLLAMPAVLFGSVLDKVLFPAIAKVQDDPVRLTEVYRRGVALIALCVLPLSAVLYVVSPEVIAVLLGDRWSGALAPFRVLVFGMLFRTSYKMSDCLARSTGAVYSRAWRQAIYAALVVGGAWTGQHWGLVGVAYGVLIALAANFLLMAELSLRSSLLTWRVFFSDHLPAVPLTAILLAETWIMASFLREWRIAPVVLLGTVGVIVAVTVAVLIRYCPAMVLGENGRRMLQTFQQYATTNIQALRRVQEKR